MQLTGTWIQRLENGDELPPDIAAIIRGLWELGYRDSNDEYDWVPMSVVRENYDRRFPGLEMTPQKFGIAFRLAYPPASENGQRRVYRRHPKGGPKVCGVCGITGPGGKRTDDDRY